ncbi:hypothetical protein BCR34DRAFT_564367 [Clohesyomyces aquaticus]|uniref:Uncharacterized protein n=1 Tax=Clohesyomyces aquaticus TaxID=1231657 RepID=A0A1Y1ZQA4_9PLEO|nr:hypothetical protein BCR34DRAFT_564367 [Clohesyomyces aquaticus]
MEAYDYKQLYNLLAVTIYCGFVFCYSAKPKKQLSKGTEGQTVRSTGGSSVTESKYFVLRDRSNHASSR